MRILVTGAAGFIGSQLTTELLSRGHDALGVDNLRNDRKEHLAGEHYTLAYHPLYPHMKYDEQDLVLQTVLNAPSAPAAVSSVDTKGIRL